MEIEYSESWETYFAETEEGPISILVNLEAEPSEEAPQPFLGRIFLVIPNPDENGFAQETEHDRLNELMDAVDLAVAEENHGLLVGRTMGQGVCTIYFYLPAEEGFGESVEKAMKAFPGQRFETATERDEHWEAYFEFLCPSEESLEYIENARVLEALLDDGDDLTTPREVTHWAYFPDAASRDLFKAELLTRNFTIEEETHEPEEPENQFGLVFSSVRDVQLEGISVETLELRKLAAGFEGEYDGWETIVVKPDSALSLNE
jgi:regulator of RNase E activity RraB